MLRSKKFIIITVLAVLVLGATLGGVMIAQADDETNSTTETANVSSFLEKVAEIYQANTGVAIDPEQLQKAITEARQAVRDSALDNYLDKLVKEGTITQKQADDFKAWLEAKPDLPIDEFQQWWNDRPDTPGLFGHMYENGVGMFGGMGRMHGGSGKSGMGWMHGGW